MHQDILFIILLAIALAANAENFEYFKTIFGAQRFMHTGFIGCWLVAVNRAKCANRYADGIVSIQQIRRFPRQNTRCFEQERETGYRISFKIPFCQVKQKKKYKLRA